MSYCPQIINRGFNESCCPCICEEQTCGQLCDCCPNINYSACVTFTITLISGSFPVDCLSGTYQLMNFTGGGARSGCTWQQTFTPASSTPCNDSEGFSCGISMQLSCGGQHRFCDDFRIQIQRIPTGFETCFDTFIANTVPPISCQCDPFEAVWQFDYTQGPTCCAGSSSSALEGSGTYQVVVTQGCESVSSSNSSNIATDTCIDKCGFCTACCDSRSCCSWILDGYPFSGTWVNANNLGPLQKISTPFHECTWQTRSFIANLTLTVTGLTSATLGLSYGLTGATYNSGPDWSGDSPCCGTRTFTTSTVSDGLPESLTLVCQQDPCKCGGYRCCLNDDGTTYCPDVIHCEVSLPTDCCSINGCYELALADCSTSGIGPGIYTFQQAWSGTFTVGCGCNFQIVCGCVPAYAPGDRQFVVQAALGTCGGGGFYAHCVTWPGLGDQPIFDFSCDPFFAQTTADAFLFGDCGSLSPDCAFIDQPMTMTFTGGPCSSSSSLMLTKPKQNTKKGCGCKKSDPINIINQSNALVINPEPKQLPKPKRDIQSLINKGKELEARRKQFKK
jgi:hypothetical protein